MPLVSAPSVNVSRSSIQRRRGGNPPASVAPADTTPNAFSFTDVHNASPSTVYESNTITVSGMDSDAPISIAGGEYSRNGGAYTAATTMGSSGDTVKLHVTSSPLDDGEVTVVLTIGGVSDTWTVTNGGSPTTYYYLGF